MGGGVVWVGVWYGWGCGMGGGVVWVGCGMGGVWYGWGCGMGGGVVWVGVWYRSDQKLVSAMPGWSLIGWNLSNHLTGGFFVWLENW